jgi:hypothetical protein
MYQQIHCEFGKYASRDSEDYATVRTPQLKEHAELDRQQVQVL